MKPRNTPKVGSVTMSRTKVRNLGANCGKSRGLVAIASPAKKKADKPGI